MMRETHNFFSHFFLNSQAQYIFFYVKFILYSCNSTSAIEERKSNFLFIFFFLGKTHFSVFMEINPLYIMR